MFGWLVKHKGIEPYVPVWDKSERKDGTFAASDFMWDEQANEYAARLGTHCAAHGVHSRTRAPISPKPTRSAIGPASWTAGAAASKNNAVPTRQCAKSDAASMKTPATWPVASWAHRNTGNHAVNAKKSKCYSRI
jgi:hypothetical protein